MAPTPQEIKLLELAARHAIAEEGSNPARKRIDILLDKNSFEEIDKFVTHRATNFGMGDQHPLGDGVITGYGRIHGRPVCVFAHDPTVLEGSLSEANTAKIVKLIDTAIYLGAPLIGLYDSTGARMQEGIASIAGIADMLFHHTRANGVIPQITAILGPCTGAAALASTLADFTLTTDNTHETALLASIRELLTFLPSSNRNTPPHKPTSHAISDAISDAPSRADHALDTLVPASGQPYDMLDLITRIVDQDETGKGHLFQLQEHHAPNLITGFARMDGRSVGIVANQPAILNGTLDSDACTKAARFIHFCNAFHIPLITFVDTPSLQPQHAAQLLSAFAEATVPRFTVIVRKAYGAAYAIMGSKHLRANLNLAWPTAEILVEEPEAAIDILYKQELESLVRRTEAIMPQGVTLSEQQKLELLSEARKEKVAEYRERFANPYLAAERGYIDAVIRPSETRRRINSAFDRLNNSNISL